MQAHRFQMSRMVLELTPQRAATSSDDGPEHSPGRGRCP